MSDAMRIQYESPIEQHIRAFILSSYYGKADLSWESDASLTLAQLRQVLLDFYKVETDMYHRLQEVYEEHMRVCPGPPIILPALTETDRSSERSEP